MFAKASLCYLKCYGKRLLILVRIKLTMSCWIIPMFSGRFNELRFFEKFLCLNVTVFSFCWYFWICSWSERDSGSDPEFFNLISTFRTRLIILANEVLSLFRPPTLPMAMAGSSPPPSWTGISSNSALFTIVFAFYWKYRSFTDTDSLIFFSPGMSRQQAYALLVECIKYVELYVFVVFYS